MSQPARAPASAYLDANIFLGFYAYLDADLEQLSELNKLISEQHVALLLPAQTADEIARNREKIIIESIEQFKRDRPSSKVPLIMAGFHDEVRAFTEAFKDTERRRAELIQLTRERAANRKLHADGLIEALIAVAVKIPCDDRTYATAMRRYQTGNPPGKGTGIGEELNWEALLTGAPHGDLHIVTRDGDYRSPFDSSKPRSFLSDEWQHQKKGKLILHKDVAALLSHFDVQIQLAAEAAKSEFVERLARSGSYANTHQAVSLLQPYFRLLSSSDADRLIDAALTNSQIGDIFGDADVVDFYSRLLDAHLSELDDERRRQLYIRLSREPLMPSAVAGTHPIMVRGIPVEDTAWDLPPAARARPAPDPRIYEPADPSTLQPRTILREPPKEKKTEDN